MVSYMKNEIEIIWAENLRQENLNQCNDSSKQKLLQEIRQELLQKVKEFNCEKYKKDSTSCNSCQEKPDKPSCEIFLVNYAGYLKVNDKKCLIIPQKICKLLNLCKNYSDEKECNRCDGKNVDVVKYNKQFSKFMHKIIKELSPHLPFDLFSPVSAYFYEEPLYSENKFLKILLLYQKREEIRASLNQILLNTHREVVKRKDLKRFDEVSYIDPEVITDILINPGRWVQVSNGCIDGKFSPTHVQQYSLEESFDTIENRYIKNLLLSIVKILDDSRKLSESVITTGEDFLSDLFNLKSEIELFLRNSKFIEVGALTQLPVNSQVLIKQSGYRELFNLDRLLRITLVPVFLSESDDILTLKRMDILWELYVMVKIIDAIKKLGYQIVEHNWEIKKAEEGYYDSASFIFNKEDKSVKVFYQKSIKVGKTGKFFLRPDFLLECDKNKIVIDAKFMIKENVRTDKLVKYLISEKYDEEHQEKPGNSESLSERVFAATIGENEEGEGYSFTWLYNEEKKRKYNSLDKLIEIELLGDTEKKSKEKYLGYIQIPVLENE